MPRGNRGVGLAALVGLATIALGTGSWLTSLYYDPSDRYPSYQEEANEPLSGTSPAADIPLKGIKEKEPCVHPQGKDESDLCAQWRAAKAGERAAFWALIQMVLSAFGMVGLVATLWFTRDALNMARTANHITRAAFETEQRAWLSIRTEIVGPFVVENTNTCRFKVSVMTANKGQTPALHATIQVMPYFREDTPQAAFAFKERIASGPPGGHPDNLFPTEEMTREREVWGGPAEGFAIYEGCAPVSLMVAVRYRTIFDKPESPAHVTIKIYDVINGPNNMLNAPFGNHRIEANMIIPGFAT